MIRFVALLLAAALTVVGAVGVATAGEVVVDAVYAVQYDFSQFGSSQFFIALVYAHGDQSLVDAQLLVNGTTPVLEDRVQRYVFDPSRNATLFVIKKLGATVVQPDDTLTALVTDGTGDSGELVVPCGSGLRAGSFIVLCKP
jgi:hypothetical protein